MAAKAGATDITEEGRSLGRARTAEWRPCQLDNRRKGVDVKRFPPEPFYVREDLQDGHHRLRLSGELDIVAAPQLEAVIRRLCAGEITAMTVDLSETTFIDSSGLRAILLGKELTDEQGHGFSIIPGPPNVQRLFELTALLDVLPFESESQIPSLGQPTLARPR
ncbi:MAG: anti-sigma-factor antagonist [Solirubrobacterales bacterium]|jgi:anti-sigma B factor antagonist|nr:anti-sigma-factor antagonist [Solirubrobacterales bacterium]